MESDTNQKQEEASQFLDFFTDLVENHVDSVTFSLSDKAVLDWFGKTVKGEKNIGVFLRENAGFKHVLSNPRPVTKIGHRDSHVINFPREQKRRSLTVKGVSSLDERTPPKEEAGTSRILEQGQGDGLHNCELTSPVKRCKVEKVVVTETVKCTPAKFMTAEGHIQFRRRSSKKYQRETKWMRPCKLEVAYSAVNVQDSTIHLIIYSNQMKCKRNLLKDFEASQSESTN